MHLEEEPLARPFPEAGKLLGTHGQGTLPSNSMAGEERGFAGKRRKQHELPDFFSNGSMQNEESHYSGHSPPNLSI